MSPGRVRIGLTGPIGCGKSTVAAHLAGHGLVVIDADVVARDVVEPGSDVLEAVVAAFGPGVLAADGSLDRSAVGRIVFADPWELARLEAIIHPAVRPRVLAAIAAAEAAGAPGVAVEAIKLVEGGLADLCDEVWLVTCDPAAQRDRLIRRGLDPADIEARVATQGDLAARLHPLASRVIDTSGSLAATRAAVDAAWQAAREAVRKPPARSTPARSTPARSDDGP